MKKKNFINCYESYYNTLVPKLLGLYFKQNPNSSQRLSIIGHQEKSREKSAFSFKSFLFKENIKTLFHTAECQRHNHKKADFAISSDLGVSLSNHYRLPHWMEFVDWSHEITLDLENKRFGELLNLEKLSNPLGRNFLDRKKRLVFFTSHLREPRESIYKQLNNTVGVDGFGPFFDSTVEDHNSSTFYKKDILRDYAFNLCPENSLYPGYVTEKIPEAFQAGCLPVTWVDPNVKCDFNPKAFINLHNFANDYGAVSHILQSENELLKYTSEPLLTKKPSILPLVDFLKGALESQI